MKEQSFDNDVNSLTGMSNSNSGAPSAIDEQAPTDAFERSWDWDFEVRELGPDETAECKVTMGADDLANLTVDGEERLYLSDDRYVKINLASSGQQEVVWVFNLLFYYLSEEKKIFLIIEEPESHLYPESQRRISETLSLVADSGNSVLVTTHSPYVLGTFNYLLMAGQVAESYQKEVSKKLRKRLGAENPNASYIRNGELANGISDEDNLRLIKNELIDGASVEINDISDYLLGFLYSEGDK